MEKRRKTITARFFQFIIIFVLISITISFSFYMVIRYQFQQSLYQNTLLLAGLLESVVESELRALNRESLRLSTNDRIQEILLDWYSGGPIAPLDELAELRGLLGPSSNIEDYVISIRIADLLGSEFINSASYDSPLRTASLDRIRSAAEGADGAVFLTVRNAEGEAPELFCVRSIRQKKNLSLEYLGALVIRYDLEKLLEKYAIYFSRPETRIFVYDDGHQIFPYRPESLQLGFDTWAGLDYGYGIRKIRGEKYLAASRTDRLVWDYAYAVSLNEISGEISRTYILVIIIHFVFIALLFVSAWFFTRRITKPMVRLSEFMHSEVEGDFKDSLVDQSVTPEMSREVASLYRNYSVAVQKIHNLLQRDYKSKIELEKTQYRILKTQINPHFLYNTLDSIGWLAKEKGIDDVAVMVRALGRLLRSTLKDEGSLIPAKDEVRLAIEYLSIQKIRFGKRLEYGIKIDASDQGWLIPPFTLQPIIENSIKYGVEEHMGEAHIAISLVSETDRLVVRIEDDGPGFPPQLLEKLKNGEFPESNSSGIGLKNIFLRGKAIMGDRVDFQFYNLDSGGAGVAILYPLQGEEADV